MKILIFMVLSVFGTANAKKCDISLSTLESNKSFFGLKTNELELREVPDGNCKLIKQEVLMEHNDSCENTLASINSVIPDSKKQYTCSLPALGLSKKTVNGQYSESVYGICYVCKASKKRQWLHFK